MSTPLLPEVVPEIDANLVSFYWGRGRGSIRFGAWLASRFRPLISMTMLHVTMLQVTIILHTFSSLTLMYHKYLGFREFQNTKNEANLLLLLGIQKLKGFQLQGATPLLRSTEPWLWGCLGRPFTKTSSCQATARTIPFAVNSLPLSDCKTCCAPKPRKMNSSSWANVSSRVPNVTSWQRSVLLVYRRGTFHPVLFANTGTTWTLHNTHDI